MIWSDLKPLEKNFPIFKNSEAQLQVIIAFHFQHDEIIWYFLQEVWFSSK